jgi:hypothetical protein
MMVTPPARCELYEFTITGTVTFNTLSAIPVSEGDPFALRYVADSEDRFSEEWAGNYGVHMTSLTFPDAVFLSIANATPEVNVRLFSNVDGVSVIDTVEWLGQWEMIMQVGIFFPPSTLGSDALPLHVPLQSATFTVMEMRPGTTPRIGGVVTSYSSVSVPEPTIASLILSTCVAQRRRFAYSSRGYPERPRRVKRTYSVTSLSPRFLV